MYTFLRIEKKSVSQKINGLLQGFKQVVFKIINSKMEFIKITNSNDGSLKLLFHSVKNTSRTYDVSFCLFM